MSKTLLLVEDSSVARKILERSLSKCMKEPFDLLHASNLSQAEQLINDNNVQLIFLDLNLNQESGFDFLKSIRDKENHTPVIIISSDMKGETVNKSNQYGVTEFVNKPFTIEQIEQSLDKVLA